MNSKPKVVIDARMVDPIGHGIGMYVRDLASGLYEYKKQHNLDYEPIFLVSKKNQFMKCFEHWNTITIKSKFLHTSELLEIPKALAKVRAHLYHSPSFSSLLNCPCLHTITIHDLNHLEFGSIAKKVYYKTLLRPFALKAKVITTVSEFSKREISHWLGKKAPNIEIVQNAINITPTTDFEVMRTLNEYGLAKGKYFLSLSSLKPHKNLETLFKATDDYRRHVADPWPLVVSASSAKKYKGVVSLGPIPSEDINALLKGCGAFLFPSIYEGFGRPPLEAILNGAPVVVSDISPHREGLYHVPEAKFINPYNPLAWSDEMTNITFGQVQAPSAQSMEYIANKYTVDKLVEGMNAVYVRCLSL